MASVRNPLAGFGLTILGALGLSFLAGIPILFLPQRELTYFYFPFALFGVGVFSGRTTFLGSLGFVAACGLGGAASGKLGLKRIDRLTERAPKMRRCLKCGAKVGMSARKCWSCRSYLPPT